MDFLTSALILAWVAIILLALVVSRLVRQVHRLSGRTSGRTSERKPGTAPIGLPPGWPAPHLADLDSTELDSTDLGSTELGSRDLRADDAGLVLLFLSTGCRTCDDVLGEAAGWAAEQAEARPAIRALYAGPAPAEAGGTGIAVRGDRAAMFEAYEVPATPFAVVVNGAGRVERSEPLGSREKARLLLASLDGARPEGATKNGSAQPGKGSADGAQADSAQAEGDAAPGPKPVGSRR